MAMQDRYLVEVQALSAVGREEIRHSYKRTCELLEHARSHESPSSGESPASQAIADVMQVRNLL